MKELKIIPPANEAKLHNKETNNDFASSIFNKKKYSIPSMRITVISPKKM